MKSPHQPLLLPKLLAGLPLRWSLCIWFQSPVGDAIPPEELFISTMFSTCAKSSCSRYRYQTLIGTTYLSSISAPQSGWQGVVSTPNALPRSTAEVRKTVAHIARGEISKHVPAAVLVHGAISILAHSQKLKRRAKPRIKYPSVVIRRRLDSFTKLQRIFCGRHSQRRTADGAIIKSFLERRQPHSSNTLPPISRCSTCLAGNGSPATTRESWTQLLWRADRIVAA